MQFTSYGRVKNGIVNYDNPKEHSDNLSFMEGKYVQQTTEKITVRTAAQNRGYWGVIVPQIINQMEARGTVFPAGFEKKYVVDAYLAKLFRTLDFGSEKIAISTRKLNIKQTSEFWESIAQWYAETFGVELMMPKMPE